MPAYTINQKVTADELNAGTAAAETYVAVTLSAGWTASIAPNVRKCPPGNATIVGSMTAGTKVDGTVIGTIPVGYRPLRGISLPVAASATISGGQSPHFDIDSAGLITCWGLGSAVQVQVCGVYPLDF